MALNFHRSILRKLVLRLIDAEVARLEISFVNLKDPGVVGLRAEAALSVEVNETLNGNADDTYFSPPDISVHQLWIEGFLKIKYLNISFALLQILWSFFCHKPCCTSALRSISSSERYSFMQHRQCF